VVILNDHPGLLWIFGMELVNILTPAYPVGSG